MSPPSTHTQIPRIFPRTFEVERLSHGYFLKSQVIVMCSLYSELLLCMVKKAMAMEGITKKEIGVREERGPRQGLVEYQHLDTGYRDRKQE